MVLLYELFSVHVFYSFFVDCIYDSLDLISPEPLPLLPFIGSGPILFDQSLIQTSEKWVQEEEKFIFGHWIRVLFSIKIHDF